LYGDRNNEHYGERKREKRQTAREMRDKYKKMRMREGGERESSGKGRKELLLNK